MAVDWRLVSPPCEGSTEIENLRFFKVLADFSPITRVGRDLHVLKLRYSAGHELVFHLE